jgi:hypothetical protein
MEPSKLCRDGTERGVDGLEIEVGEADRATVELDNPKVRFAYRMLSCDSAIAVGIGRSRKPPIKQT